MTRIEANRTIINILSQYVEDNPDIRFHQMLFNLNLEKQVVTKDGEIYNADLYNMEPEAALKRISEMYEEKPLTSDEKDENGKLIPLYKRSSISFRSIVYYDERMEELYDDEKKELEDEGIKNYKDWLKYYDLVEGEIFLMKAPEWGKKGYQDRIDYHFMCGPSIGGECVSDSIYIDWYIEQVVERAGYKDTVQTQLAENYHGMRVDNPLIAETVYLALIEGFKKDGFNVIEVKE